MKSDSFAKPFWKSKTLWAGAAFVAVGALQQAGRIPELAQYQDLLLSVAGLITVGLRFVTSGPVSLKK